MSGKGSGWLAEGAAGLPLGDVRVLDFTQALAGPYCTLVLADFGADVIKVELPVRGDDSRHWGPPFVGSDAAYFYSVNRNKRSICLDLKSDAGRQVALQLAGDCDVVVENWRPGVADRLGLGYEDIKKDNAGLVYCSISGFGMDSSARAGYDQVIQGMSGLMSLTGLPDGPPMKVGVGITDITSGMFGALAIIAALYETRRGQGGRYIDVSMQDSAIALLAYQATRYFATGVPPEREGNYHNSIAPYATFATRDGYVNICVANDTQYERLWRCLDRGDLLNVARFATNQLRVEHKAELYRELDSIVGPYSTGELMGRLEAAGIPAGPVRTLAEVFSDDSVVERGMKMSFPVGNRMMSVPGVPWKFDGATSEMRRAPAGLGEDTAEVLRGLGYGDEAVAEFCSHLEVSVLVEDGRTPGISDPAVG